MGYEGEREEFDEGYEAGFNEGRRCRYPPPFFRDRILWAMLGVGVLIGATAMLVLIYAASLVVP